MNAAEAAAWLETPAGYVLRAQHGSYHAALAALTAGEQNDNAAAARLNDARLAEGKHPLSHAAALTAVRGRPEGPNVSGRTVDVADQLREPGWWVQAAGSEPPLPEPTIWRPGR